MTGEELTREVWGTLNNALPPYRAESVAKHLVMAAQLLEEDTAEAGELAWEHAQAARSQAARLAVVREAVAMAAYRTGRYREALAELRTVRRITGHQEYLPMMADCERGLGRPHKAIELAASPEAAQLSAADRVELQLVVSGARRDLEQLDAAVSALQIPELKSRAQQPWVARLRFAYAQALQAVGRDREAQLWEQRARDVDPGVGEPQPLGSDAGDDIMDLAADFEQDVTDFEEPRTVA